MTNKRQCPSNWLRANVSIVGTSVLDRLLVDPLAVFGMSTITDRGFTSISFGLCLVRHGSREILRIRKCRKGESNRHDDDGETVFVLEYVHNTLASDDPYEFVGSIRECTHKLSVSTNIDSPEIILEAIIVFVDTFHELPEIIFGFMGKITEKCNLCERDLFDDTTTLDREEARKIFNRGYHSECMEMLKRKIT